LRALGVDEVSLATFPEEFKQGMVARAEMLGDTGENHPDRWVGGLASEDLHAIVILFARDAANEHGRSRNTGKSLRGARVSKCSRRWTWKRRRRSTTPTITLAIATGSRSRSFEGSGDEPTPGSGAPLKPGEFILGYPDERGQPPTCRNLSALAQRQLHGLSPVAGACGPVSRLLCANGKR